MASQIFFKNRYIDMHDADIVILVHLASCCIEKDEGFSSPWYTNIRNRWALSLRQSGSGLISLYLDEIIVDKMTSERLIELNQCAYNRLCEFGDTIPAAWLNQLEPGIAYYFADFDNRSLKKDFLMLINLVRESSHF